LSKIEEGKSIHQELSEDWKDDIKKAAGAAVLGASLMGSPKADANLVPVATSVPKSVRDREADWQLDSPLANRLKNYALKKGIAGAELDVLLAQASAETGRFTKVKKENLNYSANGIIHIWGVRFPGKTRAEKVQAAEPYAYNPIKLANKVYANRMGNGSESSGEGWKYRGRGIFQLTGKDMYSDASDALGVDFVKHPDWIEGKHYRIPVAIWYWIEKVKSAAKDAGKDITKPGVATDVINPRLPAKDKRQREKEAGHWRNLDPGLRLKKKPKK